MGRYTIRDKDTPPRVKETIRRLGSPRQAAGLKDVVRKIRTYEAGARAMRAILEKRCKHPVTYIQVETYLRTDTLGNNGTTVAIYRCTICGRVLKREGDW